MKFGVCTSLENASLLASHGWDYVEENVQTLLRGQESDAQWNGVASTRDAALPVSAANCLVPGSLKIVGHNVDGDALATYLETVCKRAAQVGMKTLVFGSGGARGVPDEFPRETAQQQIIEFLKVNASTLERHDITLVIEPLHRGECNIINSVGEAMEYVEAVDHPRVRCLADSFHFWKENDSLDALRRAAPFIAHVHVADLEGRVPPGESGSSDYSAFFGVLRQANYSGAMSVEASNFDLPEMSARVLAHLTAQWNSA